MSKARVAVLKVITKELSVTAAANKYGYSRQHLHRLPARYREGGGLDAVDSRSRRPHTSGNADSNQIRDLDRRAPPPANQGWSRCRAPEPSQVLCPDSDPHLPCVRTPLSPHGFTVLTLGLDGEPTYPMAL